MKTPSRFIAVAISMALAGCSAPPAEESNHGEGEEDHSEQPTHEEGIVRLSPEGVKQAEIEFALVEMGTLAPRLETTGSVGFNEDTLAHVSPRIPGRVETARVPLGARVKAGDVLATIDSIELGQARAACLQATAQAELARENHEREKSLYADHITSEREMLAARAADRRSQAALRAAEETLYLYGLSREQVDALHYDDPEASIYSVRAPFSGKVVEKHVTLGELVTPQSRLFLLADLRQVWVWIDIYERDIARVHLGDDVEVRVETRADVFEGKVTYINDRVDTDTRTVRARIDVDNPGEKLRPGMFARIQLSDPHASASEGEASQMALVPEAAVQRKGDGFVAFVFAGEGRFEQRNVSVGREVGGMIEIRDGLAPGERVVVAGAFLLKSEASKGELSSEHGH